jgi:hypothetical protein
MLHRNKQTTELDIKAVFETNIKCCAEAVSSLRRLDAGLLKRRPGFEPWSVPVALLLY